MTTGLPPRTDAPPAYERPTPLPEGRRAVSALDVGLAALGLALVALLVVVAMLPRATGAATARRALTYDALLAELADGLGESEGSALRASIRPVEVVSTVATPRGELTVRWDSLAVVDTLASPALRPGGFLADEVRRYDVAQRRRIEQLAAGVRLPASALAGGRAVVELRARENPSVFRTEVRVVPDAGGLHDTTVLAARGATSGMRVPSPFEATRTVAVVTRQAPKRFALVSPRGAVLLEDDGRTPGRAGCPFTTRGDTVRVQCRMPGSPRREIDLRFPDPLGESGTVTVQSGDRVWYDGARLARGVELPIRSGGIFRLPPALAGRASEPVALERAIGGTLGGTQWVNGRIQWRQSPDWHAPFARQLTGQTGFGAVTDLVPGRMIPLSLDEHLSQEVQQALERYVGQARQAPFLAFATVVLADATTGEVLAVAETGDVEPEQPSWLLRAVNVGSAIKPVLAAAALSELPQLGTLEVWSPGAEATAIWGVPLGQALETGCGGAARWIDLHAAIACSSNLFAASLVSASLQRGDAGLRLERAPGVTMRLAGRERAGTRPHLPLDARGTVDPDSLFASALTRGLLLRFDLVTGIEAAVAEMGRDSTPWRGLADSRGAPVRAPASLWPEESRVGLALRGERATMRQLAAVAIGAGESRLTPLQLTQAYARILTDRRVTVTLAPRAERRPAPALGLARGGWYASLRDGLRDVGRPGGTAPWLADETTRALGPHVRFYGKTGTLNSRARVARRAHVDTVLVGDVPTPVRAVVADTLPPVVVKALAFGVGRPPATGAAALGCGIVGTIYFRLHTSPAHVEPLAPRFASDMLWPILRRHWTRLAVCGDEP